MHYAEVEARREHGEGLGACLTPGHWMRTPQIQHQLRLASQQIEAARAKWLQDEEMQQAQAEAVRKMTQKQIGRMTYIREELKRLRHRAAMAAEELHQSTENLADPEVLANKKNKGGFEAHNQAMIDEVFGEIETLGLAQEKEKEEEEEKDKEKIRRRGRRRKCLRSRGRRRS